jgi:hypothetical protein
MTLPLQFVYVITRFFFLEKDPFLNEFLKIGFCLFVYFLAVRVCIGR